MTPHDIPEGNLETPYVRPDQIRGRGGEPSPQTVQQAQKAGLNRAEALAKRDMALANLWGTLSFVVMWVTFWFALAIAAAGIKVAQYIWWGWSPW